MNVASYGFILLFVPLTLFLYWKIFRHPQQKLWLLCVASYVFYAFGGLPFLAVLVGMSLITYWTARHNLMVWGIVVNLAVLVLFKYPNWQAASSGPFSAVLQFPGFASLLRGALPLGISFYVFKHVGYLLAVRAGRYPATSDLLVFLTFSALFLEISAGPISSFRVTGNQLQALPQKANPDHIYNGLIYISVGLAKKVLIANKLSTALQSQFFALPAGGSGVVWAWSSLIMFALQLYFDFSGYTDLVLGIAYLFNITLSPNFDNPYLATSPAAFWQRWHISLSNWFRVYVFFPLSRALLKRFGPERKGLAQSIATMLTMILVGLWHGATWPFVLWGAFHGLLLNFHAWTNGLSILNLQSRKLRQISILVAVLIGWALFLSPDMSFATTVFVNLFGGGGLGSFASLSALYSPDVLATTIIGVLIALSGSSEACDIAPIRQPVVAFLVGVLALICILHLGTVVNFTYVRF
jgi:alginate O-acetyltransferase complex protein AlgI